MTEPLALPPFHLRQRVGAICFPGRPELQAKVRNAVWWDDDPEVAWLNQGARLADLLERLVPAPLDGMRVLDFGCGAGRVLRHLDGRAGELHGVDLDVPSVAWLQEHTAPRLNAELTTDEPGLPYPDDHFDLVYAYSVFTHLVEHWAGWLLELRRVLKPGGFLFATVLGDETAAELGIEVGGTPPPGMWVGGLGNPWDDGGPVAVHRPEWVAERWGRAFDVVSHTPRATDPPWPHDVVVARATDIPVTEADLLRGCADAAAEGRGRRTQVADLVQHAALLAKGDRFAGEDVARRATARRAQLAREGDARVATLEAQAAALRQERAEMLASRSLRVTRPLRAFSDRRW